MKVDNCVSGYLTGGHLCIQMPVSRYPEVDTCEVSIRVVGISEGVEVGILQECMSTNELSLCDHPCTRYPSLRICTFCLPSPPPLYDILMSCPS